MHENLMNARFQRKKFWKFCSVIFRKWLTN
jgi:hypothetical protein